MPGKLKLLEAIVYWQDTEVRRQVSGHRTFVSHLPVYNVLRFHCGLMYRRSTHKDALTQWFLEFATPKDKLPPALTGREKTAIGIAIHQSLQAQLTEPLSGHITRAMELDIQ